MDEATKFKVHFKAFLQQQEKEEEQQQLKQEWVSKNYVYDDCVFSSLEGRKKKQEGISNNYVYNDCGGLVIASLASKPIQDLLGHLLLGHALDIQSCVLKSPTLEKIWPDNVSTKWGQSSPYKPALSAWVCSNPKF